MQLLPPSVDAGQQAHFAQIHELHRKRKQLSGELSDVEQELCMIEGNLESESEWG
jgi:hypothetical protein